MFQKARQNRIFQDVVDQIQEAFLEGRLQPGDALPAERELRETFGISRGTLREAFRVLEEKGLIEIRLGINGGAYIREANTDQVTESLAFLIRHRQVSLEHLGEFREAVEGIVTSLAARRAGAGDRRRLEALQQEAEACFHKGVGHWDRFVRVDERLHMALAEIAGNPIFRFILRTVHDNIHRYYDRFLSMGEEELAENYRDICDIVAAVSRGDARRSGELARDHVRRFSRYMEKKRRVTGGGKAL
jgi:DNA-binding FadR family transcriptional regulator